MTLPIATIENSSNDCMAQRLENEINHSESSDAVASNISYSMVVRRSRSIKYEYTPDAEAESLEGGVHMTVEAGWQTELVTPLQRLSYLLNLGHLSDLTIVFPDTNLSYKAHKLVLATASPVFERMFYSDMKEGRTGIVKFHNCSPSAIYWLLEHLYLGKTDLGSVLNAITVYDVAQMYEITGVSVLCRDYMNNAVSLSNVRDIFDVAFVHSEEDLMAACIRKVCSSWTDLVTNNLSNMTDEMWLYMLKKEVLPVAEVNLFKALVNWAKVKLEAENQTSSPENIRRKISKFFPLIRFLAIPTDKFIEVVMPLKIFTSEECNCILFRMRGMQAKTPKSLSFSAIPYNRVDLSEGCLRFAVLSRESGSRKNLSTRLSSTILIKDLTVSAPVLIHQIQTNDNATLRYAEMTFTDSEGKQVGLAKPVGSRWKLLKPALLQVNKSYSVCIDKVLINKSLSRKEFSIFASDVRFRGDTGDSYIKISFWPVFIKNGRV